MASTDDVIKRLIWQFSSTGADKVAADTGKVSTEQQKLAVSSEEASKASLSLEKSFDSLERRFDTTIRAQQDYEKVQQKVNAAVAQHPELQERANNVLAKASDYFEKAGNSGTAFSKIIDMGRDSLLGFAAQGGPVGALLGSFGPWGVAAAAGIGLVTTAMNSLREGAAKAGDASSGLKQFADNTGLTITQVRGLTNAGGELGVSSDTVSAAIQRFTLNLADARKGTGDLYDRLKSFDSGLAEQIASTRDGTQALDILAKAYNATTDAVTKAAIARAAFGKAGAAAGGILGTIGDEGGVNAYSAAVQKALGVTDEWTKKVAELSNQNKSLAEDLELIKSSVYTEEMLAKQKRWLEQQIEIAKATRDSLAAIKGGDYGALFSKDFAGLPADQIKALTDAKRAEADATKAAADASKISATALDSDTAATKANTAAKNDNANALARIASQSAKDVAALGTAATPEERGQSRIDALNAQFASGQITDPNILSRAIQGVRDDTEKAAASMQTYSAAADGAKNTLGDMMRINQGINQIQDSNAEAEAKLAERAAAAKGLQAANEKYNADNVADTERATAAAAERARQLAEQARKAQNAYNDMVFSAERVAAATDAAAENTARAAKTAADLAYVMANGIFAPTGGYKGTTATFDYDPGLSQVPATVAKFIPTSFKIAASQFYSDQEAAAAQARQDAADQAAGKAVTDQLATYDLTVARAKAGGDVSGQVAGLSAELGYVQGLPETADKYSKIESLQSAIDSLTKSTDSNTSATEANSELLSPYYTEDPRTSHIGFRSQGMASGGYVDVPGGYSANDNLTAMIPVASGERIYVDPMGSKRGTASGSAPINISTTQNFYGNVDKDQFGRTLYQAHQQLAKQVRAASG